MEEGFMYTPFGFDESSEQSYFSEALGDLGAPTFGLNSPAPPLDNKRGGNDYFDIVNTSIGEKYKFSTPRPEGVSQMGVRSYQAPTQLANEEISVPESYELSSLGYSEGSPSSDSTVATPDLTYSDGSPPGPGNEVEEEYRADQVEEAEALNQIIKRKRKARASPEEVKGEAKNHKKAAATDTGTTTVKKKRGRQPKLHKTKADKDAAHAAFLERNRLAAHKCREKKRIGTVQQQKALSDVVNLNADLRAELANLLAEAHGLTQTLLQHIGQPCAGGQSQVALESAQETLWTAEGTLLEMSLLRQQVGILVPPGEVPLDPVQPSIFNHHLPTMNENEDEPQEEKSPIQDAESNCSCPS